MRVVLDAPEHTLYLSLASIWELQIKVSLGKLDLAVPLEQLVGDEMNMNGIVLLPIAVEHIYALQRLPSFHKDPFDRLLIAQALVENVPTLTTDRSFQAYPINLID